VRQLLPKFAVGRMPHVISIAVRRNLIGMVRDPAVSPEHPELAIPRRGIVI
jgi:hypothetical protein